MPRWFRKKTFGYGWTPACWQGWAATVSFILLCIGLAHGSLMTMGERDRMVLVAAVVIGFIALVAFTSGKDSDS